MSLSRIADTNLKFLATDPTAVIGPSYGPASTDPGLHATVFPARDGGILVVVPRFTYTQDRKEKVWWAVNGSVFLRTSHLPGSLQTDRQEP